MVVQPLAVLCAAATWYLRFRYDRTGAQKDLGLVLLFWYALTPWSNGRWVYKAWMFSAWLMYYFYHERQRNRETTGAENRRLARESKHGLHRSMFDYNDAWSKTKPVIFPCRTSHTRLFPKTHSFSYSYLFVGIPVGWRGFVSTMLSADLKTLPWNRGQPENGWFNVDSTDYLARGENPHGLQGKLDEYLESQNEKLGDYPHAYLVTAPRFLGYSFNPVSFWYLYNEKKELKAMILEVNNTFDEKRMYFLKKGVSSESAPEEDTIPSQEAKMTANEKEEPPPPDGKISSRFSAAWQKDFHVSPFNSRKGGYSLSATDPFGNHLVNGELKASYGDVNNTITLKSSKNHPKLIARVFSTSTSIDPYSLTRWQMFRFILSWWWVGFVTFPRIVREAAKLFFGRKLHVWFRPEVLKDSVGRHETKDERAIALIFRDYLQNLVEDSNLPAPLQFISSIATVPLSQTFTPRSLSPTSEPKPLIFKPTTPLFYALLARQSDLSNFLKTTLAKQDRDPKTTIFYTSDPNLLLQLFNNSKAQRKETPSLRLSRIESIQWGFIHRLRRQPSSFVSSLDAFAMHLHKVDAQKTRAYRLAALKLLVSDYVAFGMPEVIDVMVFLMRMWLCWICVQSFDGFFGLREEFDQPSLFVLGKVVVSCVGLP